MRVPGAAVSRFSATAAQPQRNRSATAAQPQRNLVRQVPAQSVRVLCPVRVGGCGQGRALRLGEQVAVGVQPAVRHHARDGCLAHDRGRSG